jgi:hypothetical protein
VTTLGTKDWAVACGSCATDSAGFGPFAAEEARQLADTHDALQHGRHPTAALLAAAEHVERTDVRTEADEDGWF